MKLNDGKPWFRKWASIGYRPITPEGWLLLLLGFGLFLVLTLLWLQLPVDSAWEEVCGWAAFWLPSPLTQLRI